MTTLKYLGKRVFTFLVTAFGAITFNFFIPRLVPGDPFTYMLEEMRKEGMIEYKIDEIVEAWMAKFGLNEPLHIQYIKYLQQTFKGDLGVSIAFFPQPVGELIQRALPYTIVLLITTILISWVLGTVLGTLVTIKREGRFTSMFFTLAMAVNTIPFYMMALLLMLILVYTIQLFPGYGAHSLHVSPSLSLEYILDVLWHYTLPALSIITVSVGGGMLSMRNILISVMGEDYQLLAKAKGLKKSRVFYKYLMRNALLPRVTGLALSLGGVVGGSLLVEMLFSLPGMGSLYLEAVQRLDYNLMQGIFLVTVLSTLAATLLIDVLYPIVDPRVRYEK